MGIGASSAWLRVFRKRNATTSEPEGEGYNPLGGNVVVALYVKVAPDGKLVVPTAPWKLVLKDEYARYDSSYSAQTYPREVEVPVDLTAGGWQKLAANGTWQSSVGPADGSVANPSRPQAETFRWLYTWNTMRVPLGNNGAHSIRASAPLKFQHYTVGQGYGGDYLNGPATKAVNLDNLHIPASSVSCSNGTIDYFKWDPDGGAALSAPTITFTIVDADPHQYRVHIKYRRSGGCGTFGNLGAMAVVDADTRTIETDGCGVGVNENDMADPDPCKQGYLQPWDGDDWKGILTFDVWVEEYEGTVGDGTKQDVPHPLDSEEWTEYLLHVLNDKPEVRNCQ